MEVDLESSPCNKYSSVIFCVLYLMSVFGIIGGIVFSKRKNGQHQIIPNDTENTPN